MHILDYQEDGNLSSFKVFFNHLSEANRFRRILFEEIPTLAVDHVQITLNTTNLSDEYLAHRISSIPFIRNGHSEGYLRLKVKCGDTPQIILGRDLQGTIRPVNEEILILKMRPGQEVDLHVHLTLNTGKEHTRWSPISIFSWTKVGYCYHIQIETHGMMSSQEILREAIRIYQSAKEKY